MYGVDTIPICAVVIAKPIAKPLMTVGKISPAYMKITTNVIETQNFEIVGRRIASHAISGKKFSNTDFVQLTARQQSIREA